MEEKTIADWEKEKPGSSSELIGRKQPNEIRAQSTGSQMLAEEQSEPAGSGKGTGLAERELEVRSGQGFRLVQLHPARSEEEAD